MGSAGKVANVAPAGRIALFETPDIIIADNDARFTGMEFRNSVETITSLYRWEFLDIFKVYGDCL